MTARKQKKSKSTEPIWRRILPQAIWFEGWQRWGMALGLIVGLVALAWISGVVQRYVEEDGRFRPRSCLLQVSELPAWMPSRIENEVRAIDFGDDADLDLLEKGALDRVRAEIESSPWVLSAGDLHLVYPTPQTPAAIRASVRFRTPIALVEIDGKAWLTDADERRLGDAYDPADADVCNWYRLPLVTGVERGAAVPEPGERWGARSVIEGLQVARLLYRKRIAIEFPWQPIDRIDVSYVRDSGSGEIVLISEGRQLFWGRSTYADGPRVLEEEKKIAHLRDAFSDERYRGLDVFLHTERLVVSESRHNRS